MNGASFSGTLKANRSLEMRFVFIGLCLKKFERGSKKQDIWFQDPYKPGLTAGHGRVARLNSDRRPEAKSSCRRHRGFAGRGFVYCYTQEEV